MLCLIPLNYSDESEIYVHHIFCLSIFQFSMFRMHILQKKSHLSTKLLDSQKKNLQYLFI